MGRDGHRWADFCCHHFRNEGVCEVVCFGDGTYMWTVQVVEQNGGLATPLVMDSRSLMPMPSPIRDGDMVVDAVHDYLERTVTKEHFLGS